MNKSEKYISPTVSDPKGWEKACAEADEKMREIGNQLNSLLQSKSYRTIKKIADAIKQ